MKEQIIAHDLTFEPFISHTRIAERVRQLGEQIREDYRGKHPLFIGLLNGAFIFAADLVRNCELDCEITFVRLASYEGTRSSGNISTIQALNTPVQGRHVIVVEDIVDSGRTLDHFMKELKAHSPASVSLAVLLFKPTMLEYPVQVDYLGFEIPEKFVIGYGLDYNGLGRNLSSIYQLIENPENL